MATRNENVEVTAVDRDLLVRFATTGDERAFEVIVRRHCALVMGVSRRVLGDSHEAEDVMQATFAVLAKNAGKIRCSRSLAGWLYKVAHRISLRHLRERVSLNQVTQIEPMNDEDSPLERLAKRSDEETVDDELQRMPERYRWPLVLHYLEERSYQEIAEELGITLPAVAGRIKRGRGDLRRRLLRRGITLSGFVTIVSSTQPSIASPATQALIRSVVENSIAFANGNTFANLTSHHLAQLEHANMMLPITKAASLAAVTLLAIGFGSYGAVSFVSAQSPRASADNVHVLAVHQAAADISEATTTRFGTSDNSAGTGGNPFGPSEAGTSGLRYRMAIEDIESQLDGGSLELSYLDTPLRDVFADFQSRLKIPVLIDGPALEDFGIGIDTPMTIDVKGISTRSALRLLLDPHELTYVIADEVILITTAEVAENRLDTRVYDVVDTGVPTEHLIDVITETVHEDSWSVVGGPGKIASATPTRLVIAQTQRIHGQVTDLIEQLKRAAK